MAEWGVLGVLWRWESVCCISLNHISYHCPTSFCSDGEGPLHSSLVKPTTITAAISTTHNTNARKARPQTVKQCHIFCCQRSYTPSTPLHLAVVSRSRNPPPSPLLRTKSTPAPTPCSNKKKVPTITLLIRCRGSPRTVMIQKQSGTEPTKMEKNTNNVETGPRSRNAG